MFFLLSWYIQLVEGLESLMIPCVYKWLLGADCPGCGLQRSIILLLKGHWRESVQTYWATIPMLLMFFFCFLHLRYRFSAGLKILVFMYVLNGIIIFCQYIYKLTA